VSSRIRGPASLGQVADATRQHKERRAAYDADRAAWQALIASWLAPPPARLILAGTCPSTTCSPRSSRLAGSPTIPARPPGGR
jgi:hypothetical protein